MPAAIYNELHLARPAVRKRPGGRCHFAGCLAHAIGIGEHYLYVVGVGSMHPDCFRALCDEERDFGR